MIIPPPVLPNPLLRHEPRRVRPPHPRRPVREPHAHDQLGAGGDGVRAEGGVVQGLAEGERDGGEEAEGFGDDGGGGGGGEEGPRDEMSSARRVDWVVGWVARR